MEVHDEWIPVEEFSAFIEAMPQVCVELFVEYDDGVLLTKRTNEPAKGEWFWPGGRLFKGERPEAAARRIAADELGIDININELLGVYNQFWETSDLPGSPSRHTVNFVYRAHSSAGVVDIELDEQHEDWCIIRSPDPTLHDYVRQYLEDAGVFG